MPAAVPPPPPQAETLALAALAVLVSPLFLSSVLLPTAVAAVYYGLIASDTFVSESRFVVRSPQRPQLSGLGAILQGGGFARSQDDTYSVHDYVLSRDALAELEKKLNLRQVFSAESIDPFNRFTALEWDLSFESFYKYYRKRVARRLRRGLGDHRAHGARLYRRGRAQRQRLAAAHERAARQPAQRPEPQRPDQRGREGGQGLRGPRQGSVARALQLPQPPVGVRPRSSGGDAAPGHGQDPGGAAGDGDAAGAVAPGVAEQPADPEPRPAASELLREAIGRQEARVAGKQPGSFTTQSSGYDRLVLEKTFAERQLATSLAALENARNEAQRQQLYLETLVQPNLPDKAIEPRRLRTVAMVFLLGLIVWGVLSLVVSSVREHTE